MSDSAQDRWCPFENFCCLLVSLTFGVVQYISRLCTQIVSMCHMTGVYLNESIIHDSTAKSNLLYCREHELIYLRPNAILCELNALRFFSNWIESNRIENQYWNVDFYFSLTQFGLLETNCCLRSSSKSISQNSRFSNQKEKRVRKKAGGFCHSISMFAFLIVSEWWKFSWTH